MKKILFISFIVGVAIFTSCKDTSLTELESSSTGDFADTYVSA